VRLKRLKIPGFILLRAIRPFLSRKWQIDRHHLIVNPTGLQAHNDKVGRKLAEVALELATCPMHQIPVVTGKDRKILATEREIQEEVSRRVNPMTYEGLWGKPLKEVREEIKRLGRPLAPQSIEELNRLFETYPEPSFDEEKFVEDELKADSRLYRDPRFRLGIIATLEQKVADFREVHA